MRRLKKKKTRQKVTRMKINFLENYPGRNLWSESTDLSYPSQLNKNLQHKLFFFLPEKIVCIISEYAVEKKHKCIGLKDLIRSQCMNWALRSQPRCKDCTDKIKNGIRISS